MFSDILLTVDYDRTLTDPEGAIPQRNLDAIRYFMDNGGAFTVNSGRSVPAISSFRDIVPVNAPYLLYNGSAWYDAAAGTLQNSVPMDLHLPTLFQQLQSRFPGLTLEVQGVDHHYAFSPSPAWEAYCRKNGMSPAYADVNTFGAYVKLAIYSPFLDDTVSSMYRELPEDEAVMQAVEAFLAQEYGDRVTCFRACPRLIDLHAPGCSKAASARALQKRLGRKILVCAGDGLNDLSMMEDADFAFCPGDSIIRDRFETVCDCGQGAVADVIEKKIPEILGIQP